MAVYDPVTIDTACRSRFLNDFALPLTISCLSIMASLILSATLGDGVNQSHLRCERGVLSITGRSMFPLLHLGRSVQVEWRGRDKCGELFPGRIAVFRLGNRHVLQVKRIAARGGDLVTLKPNGDLLREGLLELTRSGHTYPIHPGQWQNIARGLDQDSRVIAGQNIVLGETWSGALDSRIVGPIADEDIVGVVTDDLLEQEQEI